MRTNADVHHQSEILGSRAIAFSSEVDAGSREENASN
jgi:hypothetical protein